MSRDVPDSTEAPDELIGRCFNDTYRIEGIIGQGGVGRVYRARHARIKTKLFALKVLHPEHSRDVQQLARFQQEAEAAATLSHPNVVGVYDVGRTDDGYSYLACELLSGVDLDVYLERHGKLDIEAALRVGLQICEALETAHAQNIVHRDLKPQNVFLLSGPDGTLPAHPDVKLLDFGLSRFLDHTDTQLTKTGAVMGTPAFMAPEQAMGKRGDHRVDIYGLGVILYAAITGRPPFQEDNLTAMLVAVMTQEPPRPAKLVAEIPEALELVIQRAMAKEADDRYATIAEVRTALEGLLSTSDHSRPPDTAAQRPRMGSIVLDEENYDLRTSRPRLVFYGLAATLIGISFVASAVSGLELLIGPIQLSPLELGLIMAGITGTMAMPAVLAFKHFKKTIWSNSAKVMDALNRLRGPLTACLVAYGAAAIAIRFLDDFWSRFGSEQLLTRVPGLGWGGFTWVFPVVSVMVATIAYLKRRALEGPYGTKRRAWLGAPTWLLTLACVGGLLFWGLRWRQSDLAQRREAAILAAKSDTRTAPPTDPSAMYLPAPAEPPAPPEPIKLASDEELALALAQGESALLPLSEKYPRDARVLEPLLLEFASRATGFADAMITARKLLEVAPEKRDSPALGTIVQKAARTPGKASQLALELMQGPLGSQGADLLHELQSGSDDLASRAKQLLSSQQVQTLISPALRVLIDLEQTKSCAEKVPLLPRASSLGDDRAAALLGPLARGSKTGCGKWKNQPCRAPCHDQRKAFLDTVSAIQIRKSRTEL